ncbi:MAG: NAD-dependent malic enzyme [Candidatus Gastranaerophilales bacterium]|nr:NAD-dependent malic enzyme [Candidatus Gastranaerophilales bacterium]
MELTNKANSIAIFAFENKSDQAKEKAETFRINGFDAYPIILKKSKLSTQRIIESLRPTFGYFDVTLIDESLDESKFNTYIPKVPLSYDVPMAIDLSDDIKTAAVELHMHTRGVIKQAWCYDEPKLVGVVSNGSAVLGFGKIGPDAAMPVMEGKAALFKKFGGVDAIPICIDACDVEEFKNIVKVLEPTFSGLNLEDICAPDCFDVEEELIKEMNIPIFHDDQHGTAIVVLAGLINALKLIKKDKTQVKVVFSGAGAAAIAVCKLLLAYGLKNITLTDINGAIYKGREHNDKYLEQMAQKTNPESVKGALKDVIVGADVFIGLSAQGVLTPDMIKTMADKPVIFALANPNPEIMPDIAKEAGAYIIATGRSDFSNQVNNSLVFPGVFKGILQSDVKVIDDTIKIKAAEALAQKVDDVSVNKIIPDPMDMEIAQIISAAILDKQG